ncbi:conserved hypothetical protein [Neospora caninum Liverpool]|uniref:Cyclic phosphodiesterase-like protein n=1 Tax=Neospora caninum (strain Liverpool) TaxID=572307 RepID=F0VR18_NEOCL|nr:conserved hypothetical protein [Neospora caninum Liverpool]CBZ56165.1 conserved hypothetical protein [Neospora caninum Liverpool]CEL70922.1 TPA: hypothetical protein BN1204_065910 [Neospora caninum Liverpool]|eukprot:XP_003886191.1 conserved hypothetical protein [Neospora caninum Liverpool]
MEESTQTSSPPPAAETLSLWLTVRLHPAAPLPSSPFSPSPPSASSSAPFFPARAVADLSECLDTPNFIPHITLLGGGLKHLCLDQITAIIKKAVGHEREGQDKTTTEERKTWKPFFVRVAEVTSGDLPFQCIYARIRKPGEPSPGPSPANPLSASAETEQPAERLLEDAPEELFALHAKLRAALYDAFDVPYRGDNDAYMPHVSLVYAETAQLSLEKRRFLARILNDTEEIKHAEDPSSTMCVSAAKGAQAAPAFLTQFEQARERFGKTIRGTFVSVESVEVVQTPLGKCSEAGRWRILASIPLRGNDA